MSDQALEIHVIADSTGETAARLARAAQAQFPNHPFRIVRHPRVTTAEELFLIFDTVRGHVDRPVVVMSTLVNPVLRDLVDDGCAELGLVHIDLLGPTLQQLEFATGVEPERVAMRPVGVEKDYFTRIAAMEFAVRHDDGQQPEGLKDADIVIVAASRCGKTPLSMYLGYLGYKTANVPLVPRIKPPAELYAIDRWRIVGLTLDPQLLAEIRTRRLKGMGSHRRSDGYAELAKIYDEFDEIRAIQRGLGCPVLDTTKMAMEESAARIIDIVDDRARANGGALRRLPAEIKFAP
ncbi:pyruvate, water dikinase regulatory protein [Granulicoccus sp. GXG6511]|uniref:pyruvate, water dikinase regulatory protein n=1 Tax=Granulicoccus sp. GXG6511 TaxID=3381351 RepID=UPI003D7ED8AA